MTPFYLSAFMAPGAGQLYRREFLKGVVILGLCLFGFAWLFVDLCSIVKASVEAKPLLETDNIVERALEIRHGISLRRFITPLIIIVASYVWGVLDILWTMHKEKESSQQTENR